MKRMIVASVLAASLADAAPFDKSGIADWTKPPPPTAEPTFQPPTPTSMHLPNGMSVLVIENHAVPTVHMRLIVPGAGSASDPSGKPGVADFTADMMDEGFTGVTAIELAQILDQFGATLNLSVDGDATYLDLSTLTSTLAGSLDTLTDIVAKPTFDPADFARVAGDRAANLDLLRDRADDVAWLVERQALFGAESPYGHPVEGRRASFKSITLADIKAFYASQWNPGAMTLVVVGDVETTKLLPKLNMMIGRWKPSGVHPLPPVVSPKLAAQRLQLVDRPKAQQSDVRFGLLVPDIRDPRRAVYDVLTNALCGGFTARVTQRLREQLGIIYHAYARTEWHPGQQGPYMIEAPIDTPHTAQGITEVVKMFDDFAATPMTTAELDKTKQNLIRGLPALFDTNARAAVTFGQLALLGLPAGFYTGYAAAIRKVTAADIQAVAKDAMPTSKVVITVVGDMAKVRSSIDALNLGGAKQLDLYGMPVK